MVLVLIRVSLSEEPEVDPRGTCSCDHHHLVSMYALPMDGVPRVSSRCSQECHFSSEPLAGGITLFGTLSDGKALDLSSFSVDAILSGEG